MSLFIKQFYRFGEFTLDTDQRVLLRAGRRLAMPPKVFETLTILVESNGRIVERKELMNRLWPDSFVEESNLTFNIQQLRKFLGDDARHPLYIETIARRGYRFIANVEEFLSDGTEMDGSITQRFETSEAQSRDAAGDLSGGTSTQASELTPTSASQHHPVTAEKKFDAPPATPAATTRVNKRSIALAAGVLILSGVGLVFWKFSMA